MLSSRFFFAILQNIDVLEMVQLNFLKYTFVVKGKYPPKGVEQNIVLKSFKLQYLQNRRNVRAVIILHKIIAIIIDCNYLLYNLNFYDLDMSSRTRK